MITFIMGKTCSGKTRIVEELCKKYGYHKLVTYTTRPMRKAERDGVDYHFLSTKEFIDKINMGFFAEYKQYNTNDGIWLYGVAKEDIEKPLDKSVLIVTPDGYRDIAKVYPDLKCRLLYIYANNKTIKNRASKRGDNTSEMIRRIKADSEDFKGVESLADKIIYNNDCDDLDMILEKINDYVEANQ